MTRGPTSEWISPNVGDVISLLGSRKLVWFRKLNSSPRNWNSFPSATRIFLTAEKSQSAYPGPCMHDVAPFVTELLHRRVRIWNDLPECALVQPFLRCMRTGVWVPDQVRPIAGEAGDFWRTSLQGNVGRIEHRERCAAHESQDAIELPVAERTPIPAMSLLPERNAPLVAQHQAAASVKHRPAALGCEVERILRQVILSGDGLGGGARDVDRGDVVDRFRMRIRGQEREAVAETLAETGFQGVIVRIRDAGDLAHGCVGANVRRWRGQAAPGIEPSLVDIVYCGLTRKVNRWIPFDEARQPDAVGAYVSDLEQPVGAERPLDVDVPVLRVRQV